MVIRKMVRFSAVAILVFACALATEVRAQIIAAQTAPLSCTVPLGNGTLLVETVPGGNSSTFPHDVPCPNVGGTCSEYNYKFTSSSGNTLSKSFLSVSSDLAIFQTTPSATIEDPACKGDLDVPLIGRFVCEQRTVRFGSQPNGFSASVIVTRSVPRVSTSGSFVGLLNSGFCLIQGPGVPGGAFTPITTTSNQKAAGGKCDVIVTNGANGRPVKIETSTEGCAVASQVDLTINGLPFKDSNGAPITFGTGTSTCYATTPKPTCVCRNPATPCPNNF